MTRLGFVIDQRKCIGCHACTLACKSEHDVPLGVFRTWVKVVEKGSFPNTRKHFLVERCNHCEDAPCVNICPTKALYKRDDGIVDFNKNSCIGCKSCMEACPYEAIYIDPDSHTAAKCNFCAHRTSVGLQPACVIVCPVQAIISGDLEDPTSEIAHLVGRENVQVRKPEKNTKPQLYYLGADQTALNPEATASSVGSMWSEPNTTLHGRHTSPEAVVPIYRPLNFKEMLGVGDKSSSDGVQPATVSSPKSPTSPPAARQIVLPIVKIDRMTKVAPNPQPPAFRHSVAAGVMAAGADAQVDYNVSHERPWGFLVSLYLWTKSIGAGAFMILALALGLGLAADSLLFNTLAPIVALLFISLTTLLLVLDLKRPERFLYILTRPNWTSWLVWGAYILIGFSGILVLWLFGRIISLKLLEDILLWPGVAFAVMSAIYSAFLFGQAKGRDLWQSPTFLPHLFVQALLSGSAVLLILGAFTGTNTEAVRLLDWTLLTTVLISAAIILGEIFLPHINNHVARSLEVMRSGRLSGLFWGGFILAGTVLPVALVATSLAIGPTSWLGAIAGLLALGGLLAYEHCFIEAGQEVPLS